MFARQVLNDRFNFFSSNQPNAPQMNGANGSEGQLLQVLDACLVTGFNQQTVSSVSVNGDLVTLKYGVHHGYMARQLIIVTGATDNNLNGEHRIIEVLGNDLVIKKAGVTQTTGTIATKLAPLNWESVFGTSQPLQRAYRSKNSQSTKTVLFLDMSLPTGHGYHLSQPAKRAMVTLCQDMQTIGVPINDYTVSVNDKEKAKNGCLFWYQKREAGKERAVNSTKNNSWVIVGNGDYFLLFNAWSSYNSALDGQNFRDLLGFGDCISVAGDYDRFNTFLFACNNPDDRIGVYSAGQGAVLNKATKSIDNITNNQFYFFNTGIFIKDFNGLGGVIRFSPSDSCLFSTENNLTAYTGLGNIAFPNPANLSLVVRPIELVQENHTLRGIIPRLLSIKNFIETESDLLIIDNVLLIKVQKIDSTGAQPAYYGFDVGD